MTNKIPTIILFACTLAFFFSCQKEEFITDSSAKLEFSLDTITYDTVFTTIGSTTRQIRVYNRHKESIRISSIRIAGGDNSYFRMNVDGQPANSVTNVEIAGKDSIYIFVEVTVDPQNNNSPVLINDSIVFETNGNIQDVNLVAFGQDVHLINGEYIQTSTWTNDKPYLVYNSLAVDSNQILTIEAGTKIYSHKGSVFYVYPTATLIVNGTKEAPVLFKGDRLEEMFKEIPGQWGYIHLTAGSKNNKINYAVIKNGIAGIVVDTVASTTEPTLRLSNTIIQNMSSVGLSARGSRVICYNSVFANCADYAVSLAYGGEAEFYHCTIANYWGISGENRSTPSLLLNNYYAYKDNSGVTHVSPRALNKAYFGNCIIWGNRESEVEFDNKFNYQIISAPFVYKFENCLIRLESEINTSDQNYFKNIILNEDPNFKSTYFPDFDFQLDTLSPCKEMGNLQIINDHLELPLSYDLNGNSRPNGTEPDLGAYERQE